MNDFINGLFVFLGINIPQGEYSVYYNFWSGFGNVLERLVELLFIGYLLYYRHNCHVWNCPRMGKYPLEGTPYTLCLKHHPDTPKKITHNHVKNINIK